VANTASSGQREVLVPYTYRHLSNADQQIQG
jgi:hypothetical protein